MNDHKLPQVYVTHYSLLHDRKSFLWNELDKSQIKSTWITEKSIESFNEINYKKGKILGVSEKLAGMDLGINSRSLIKSRRLAKFEGYLLFVRSFFSKSNSYSTGSLPSVIRLKESQIELQKMHLTAISKGVKDRANWVLVLEDDAVPSSKAFENILFIIKSLPARNTWISLSSGAGLQRTDSEKIINETGLFRVRPAATRCSVAYLVSLDLAQKVLNSAREDGIPNWLPIDFYYQVLLRKFKSKAYWTDPAVFEQGSETGQFISGFERLR